MRDEGIIESLGLSAEVFRRGVIMNDIMRAGGFFFNRHLCGDASEGFFTSIAAGRNHTLDLLFDGRGNCADDIEFSIPTDFKEERDDCYFSIFRFVDFSIELFDCFNCFIAMVQ